MCNDIGRIHEVHALRPKTGGKKFLKRANQRIVGLLAEKIEVIRGDTKCSLLYDLGPS